MGKFVASKISCAHMRSNNQYLCRRSTGADPVTDPTTLGLVAKVIVVRKSTGNGVGYEIPDRTV